MNISQKYKFADLKRPHKILKLLRLLVKLRDTRLITFPSEGWKQSSTPLTWHKSSSVLLFQRTILEMVHRLA